VNASYACGLIALCHSDGGTRLATSAVGGFTSMAGVSVVMGMVSVGEKPAKP
jgi:hypothetical protein